MWSRASLALSCLLTIAACSTDGSEPSAEGEATSTEETGETSETGETEESGIEDGPCVEDDAPADAPSFAWRIELPSELDDTIGALAIDAEGRVHVVGWIAEPDPFPNDSSPTRSRAFVGVFSPAGEELSMTLWAANGGFEGNIDVTRPTELVLAPTGERYVAGQTNAQIGGVGGINGDSGFVAQLAADGSPAWVRTFDAFDSSGYEAPQALTLSPSGELYFAWGSAEVKPLAAFGFPSHRLSRLSSSGEVEAEAELELGEFGYIYDLATDCEGERVFIVGNNIQPKGAGFLARVTRELEPLGLTWAESANSGLRELEVQDAGVYVLGEGIPPTPGGSTGWFGRYDLQGQLQWSQYAAQPLTGLARRGRVFVSSKGLRVLGLGEPEGVGWEVELPAQGGGFEEITRVVTGPHGSVAVAGRNDEAEGELQDAFVALLVP